MAKHDSKNQDFETRAIHAAYDASEHGNAVNPPIHFSSTFAFPDTRSGMDVFAGESRAHSYTRISNPTLDLLERRMADLENAEAALSSASGMGSITSVLWTFLKQGDEIIVDKTLYGCTFSFLHHGMVKFGVRVTHVDLTDPDSLRAAISDRTKIVYLETIANPNMRVIDVAQVAEIAHGIEGCRVIVDNTYLTPALYRPIDDGADIVVHSATKYLGGHGDLIAGIASGSAEDIEMVRLLGHKDMTGAVMSPMTAMLVMRGLKSLSLRMERHSENALFVARKLADHPAVAVVHYPGLADSPFAEIAGRKMAVHGGVLAFELHGGFDAAIQFMDSLDLITRAVSLGDTESLVQHPASMTHSTYTPEEQVRHGITSDLVRLSLGLESARDIWADIEQALDAVPMSTELVAAV